MFLEQSINILLLYEHLTVTALDSTDDRGLTAHSRSCFHQLMEISRVPLVEGSLDTIDHVVPVTFFETEWIIGVRSLVEGAFAIPMLDNFLRFNQAGYSD